MGEGRDTERRAARGAASLRGGTREPGTPPMSVRPEPQDSTAGTAPTERRGAGCPPTGGGPDRTPTDAPPPAASTDCACPAGCAGPETGEVAPPPLLRSPTRRRANLPPPRSGGTSWKHRSSDKESSPNQTQAEVEADPQRPGRHKEKATRPPPCRLGGAGRGEDGLPNPQSPQKPTGLRPPDSGSAGCEPNPPWGNNRHPLAHRLGAGEKTPHRTETQTPPRPRLRQKGSPGNSEGYKNQTPAKAPHTFSTAPAEIPRLRCNHQRGPP
ncbi:proline-rich protein 2-like [Agelaius tricolor]|uniref:proline-rich protein 2-like n=1 Tax=Agelaius tricolor TaxID=9191 RepID=UPI0039F1FB81